jgi:hypothetical protein
VAEILDVHHRISDGGIHSGRNAEDQLTDKEKAHSKHIVAIRHEYARAVAVGAKALVKKIETANPDLFPPAPVA